jgi:hypothetical protein
MRRTTLAAVLATGALAVPAVAFAAGGDDQTPQTAPTQQEQPQQRPDRGDCPEHDESGGPGAAPSPSPESGGPGAAPSPSPESGGPGAAPSPSPESGGSGSGDTLL